MPVTNVNRHSTSEILSRFSIFFFFFFFFSSSIKIIPFFCCPFLRIFLQFLQNAETSVHPKSYRGSGTVTRKEQDRKRDLRRWTIVSTICTDHWTHSKRKTYSSQAIDQKSRCISFSVGRSERSVLWKKYIQLSFRRSTAESMPRDIFLHVPHVDFILFMVDMTNKESLTTLERALQTIEPTYGYSKCAVVVSKGIVGRLYICKRANIKC